jgi:hypothetical protein
VLLRPLVTGKKLPSVMCLDYRRFLSGEMLGRQLQGVGVPKSCEDIVQAFCWLYRGFSY